MISFALFSGIKQYIQNVVKGMYSIVISCVTVLPYLFKWGELQKEVTEGYPDPISSKTPEDLPPRSRGLLFNDIDRCTGCKACEKVCPSQCITVVAESGANQNKIWVSIFDIDFSKCIFCGLCVEVCQPTSLVHTRQYEGAAYQLSDLIASFGRGQVTSEQRAKWMLLRQMSEDTEKEKIW